MYYSMYNEIIKEMIECVNSNHYACKNRDIKTASRNVGMFVAYGDVLSDVLGHKVYQGLSKMHECEFISFLKVDNDVILSNGELEPDVFDRF